MKKLALVLCVVGSAMTLAACQSSGDASTTDYDAPYSTERTAGGGNDMAPARARPAPAERTFSAAQSK